VENTCKLHISKGFVSAPYKGLLKLGEKDK
jgi:hypothetical protein